MRKNINLIFSMKLKKIIEIAARLVTQGNEEEVRGQLILWLLAVNLVNKNEAR